MIPDLDIYRSANVLVKHHGQDAPFPPKNPNVNDGRDGLRRRL